MSDFPAKLTPSSPRPMLAWGLLVAWLAYSAGWLGWQLVNDPLLTSYVCRTR